jgi:LPXTG-motif cell wall-anchored protein
MNYGNVLGVSTGAVSGGAVAVLPNTGGSRSVLLYAAVGSLVAGAVVLLSTFARVAAKRRYNA